MENAVHSTLTGIAGISLAALICGIFLERLKQPAIVGYILAGVLLGPSVFAVIPERETIDTIAELGVLMLLFLVGMELSLRSFRKLWRLAVSTTVFQIIVSTSLMALLSIVFDWSLAYTILLGFVVALSSTAVAIKILENMGELRTRNGRIAVGVLIAQDLAVVPMMLVISSLGGDGFQWIVIFKIIISIAVLAGLIFYLSGGRKINLPLLQIAAGNEDLKPLAGLAICFGFAALSGLAGLSAAYGAFIAGLVIGNSTDRGSMLEAVKPIQSILMMVFFVSIGLLVDLSYMWQNLSIVVMLFLFIAVFKTALNVILLRLFGQQWKHAFMSGLMVSQVGEFSFLLSVVAVNAGLISLDERQLIVAITVVSLIFSPLWVFTSRRLQTLIQYGVTNARDMLQLVYGPEAEMVVDTFDEARTQSQRFIRYGAGTFKKIKKLSKTTKEKSDPETKPDA